MEITKDTRISDILEEYGDIADVMELFGVKRVGRYSLPKLIKLCVGRGSQHKNWNAGTPPIEPDSEA